MAAKVRVLSIDGGGIRGIIPSRILREFEIRSGLPITKLFDFGVGTSAGAIIIGSIAAVDESGNPIFSTSRMVEFYLDKSKSIFGVSYIRKILSVNGLLRPKISRVRLDHILRDNLQNKRISQCAFPIAITAYNIDECRPQIWSTLDARESHKNDHYLCDIIGASCSAPTYFSPKKIKMDDDIVHYFIDGGVFQNNPQVVPLLELSKIDPHLKKEDMLMISIGTGTSLLPVSGEKLMKAGVLGWLKNGAIVDVIMDGASDFSDIEGGVLYPYRYRIQMDIPVEFAQVDNHLNAKPLLALVEEWIKNNGAMIDEIVSHLVHSREED